MNFIEREIKGEKQERDIERLDNESRGKKEKGWTFIDAQMGLILKYY